MFPVIFLSITPRSRFLLPPHRRIPTNIFSKAAPLPIDVSNMRLPLDSAQRMKNYIHAAQGFVLLLCWVLTIAVFGQAGPTHGVTVWYFVLVPMQYLNVLLELT